MKNEFILAFNEVLEEKQLPKDIIMKALESAMVSAYRRAVNASTAQHVEARIDPETGRVMIFAEKEVVDSVQEPITEVTLEVARQFDPEAELGSLVIVESTPGDFGRVAAQTARQVIQQRIREAERTAQVNHYSKQMGEIVNGIVQAVNAQGVTVGLDLKAEGLLSRKDMIPGERFHVHDRVRALLAEVKDSPRGPQIILSRGHRNFLRRLLETEVPEIYHGVVEIRSISREPGQRAKVAVAATQQGIDPVGACVGIRGVRIQAIVRELHDEKIDVIEWNNDAAAYIAKAISPARVTGVYITDAGGNKTATVVVPEDQLSLAIGRDGQNARLAAKLTGWRIDIKSLPEAAADSLTKLRTDESYASIAEAETNQINTIEAALQKKEEGRSLSLEDVDALAKFVDRVERRYAVKRQSEIQPEDMHRQEVINSLPPVVFEMPLDELKLSDHITEILLANSFMTVGDLTVQLRLNPDSLLALQGMGPKAMSEIEAAVDAMPILHPLTLPAIESIAQPVEVEDQPEVSEPQVEELTTEIKPTVELKPVVEVGPEEELPQSLDEIFAMKPEVLVAQTSEETEEDGSGDAAGKKGKKKKKRSVEMEFDPDRGVMVAKKKHKHSGSWGDWEDW